MGRITSHGDPASVVVPMVVVRAWIEIRQAHVPDLVVIWQPLERTSPRVREALGQLFHLAQPLGVGPIGCPLLLLQRGMPGDVEGKGPCFGVVGILDVVHSEEREIAGRVDSS